MSGLLICPWLEYVKKILEDCGMNYVFYQHQILDKKWLQNSFLPSIKNTLKDQELQKWTTQITEENQKFFYYREFATNFGLKNYFMSLPQDLWIPLCKFRTNNHKLPVEVYSWSYFKKTRNERICFMCEANDIGDEYHYLMLCPAFKDLRTFYLPKYYRERPFF